MPYLNLSFAANNLLDTKVSEFYNSQDYSYNRRRLIGTDIVDVGGQQHGFLLIGHVLLSEGIDEAVDSR